MAMTRLRISATAAVGAWLAFVLVALPVHAGPVDRSHRLSPTAIRIRPISGPAGAEVTIQGRGFDPDPGPWCYAISVTFTDANATATLVASLARATTFTTTVQVPSEAMIGAGTFEAAELGHWVPGRPCTVHIHPAAAFTVTGVVAVEKAGGVEGGSA